MPSWRVAGATAALTLVAVVASRFLPSDADMMLVYVRDVLPDVTIALETANDGIDRSLTVSRA